MAAIARLPTSYRALMGEFPLMPIRSGAEYDRAAKIIHKLALREGKLDAGQSYRLPTDAEWSIAVGLEGETGETPMAKDKINKEMYPWPDNQWPPPRQAGNLGSVLKVDDYDDSTSPVGSFPPNRFGLFDMAGNVRQWCEDAYANSPDAHVLRGSSWRAIWQELLYSSCRTSGSGNTPTEFDGFRCVLVTAGK